MNKFSAIAFLFLILFSCKKVEKTSINLELKKELSEIFYKDQIYRIMQDSAFSPKDIEFAARRLKVDPTYFKNNYISWGMQQDPKNMEEIEKIFSKYGYPGKTLVGEPENNTAFFVIQHSNKIPKYLPLIKREAEKGEIKFILYAMMLDRYLMEKGEEQIYGTQGYGFFSKDKSVDFIWPIKNPEKVNELRKKAGFKQTVEEYAKDLYGNDFQYKIYTIEEVKKLQAQ